MHCSTGWRRRTTWRAPRSMRHSTMPWAKSINQPVYNLIGGLAQPRIPLEWSISMASDPKKDGRRRRAGRARIRHQGPVHQVRPSVRLARGCESTSASFAKRWAKTSSSAWTPTPDGPFPRRCRRCTRLTEHRVDYLEQPVKRHDLAGMAAIRRAATGVPLMADEACQSIHDAHAIIAAEAADVLCIKLYKHGGITPARKIAAIAEAGQHQDQLRGTCGAVAARGGSGRALLCQPAGGACHAGRRIHLRSWRHRA